MNQIGLHLRLNQKLQDVIEKAIRLEIPTFQIFFLLPDGKYIKPEINDKNNFLLLRRKHFGNLYLHASYWINLCSAKNNGYSFLEKEILWAKKLEFTHLILHPGAATGCKTKLEGIDFLAQALNKILKKENDIKIILENTAHSGISIGGDLNEFHILLTKLDHPDKISFCIDTAHAYSFGYNLTDPAEQNKFFELIDQTIGKNNVSLIHLNDTSEELGSKIDKHNIPGYGNIGESALKQFVNHPGLDKIQILLELPNLAEEEEKIILSGINKWK